MAQRKQKIVCASDQRSPSVSAFDTHECVYETLHLEEHEVVMIQIDKIQGPREDAGNTDSDPGARGFSTRKRRNLPKFESRQLD